jgi:hypothetical protein
MPVREPEWSYQFWPFPQQKLQQEFVHLAGLVDLSQEVKGF